MTWVGGLVNGAIGGLFSFLASVVNALFGVLGFPSLQTSVFGVEANHPGMAVPQPYGPFDATQWAGLMHIEVLFVRVTWALVVLLVGWLAYRMMSVSDARSAGEVASLIWRTLCIGLMVSLVPWGVSTLLAANAALAQSIAAWDPSAVGLLSSQSFSAAAVVSGSVGSHKALLAVDGILKLLVAGLRLLVAVLMVERMVVIAALLVIGPVVCWSWVWNPRGTAWGLWLAELVSLAFIPASLAIVAAAMQSLFWSTQMHAWARLVALAFVIPTAGLLRKLISGWFGLIGMHEDRTAMAVGGGLMAAGMVGGIAAVGGVGRAMLPGGGASPAPSTPKRTAIAGSGSPGSPGAAAAAGAAGASAGGGAASPGGASPSPTYAHERAMGYGAQRGAEQARAYTRAAAAVTGAAGAVAGGAVVAGLHMAGAHLKPREAADVVDRFARGGKTMVAGPAARVGAVWGAVHEHGKVRREQGGSGLGGMRVTDGAIGAALHGAPGAMAGARGDGHMAHQATMATQQEAARRAKWLAGLDGPED